MLEERVPSEVRYRFAVKALKLKSQSADSIERIGPGQKRRLPKTGRRAAKPRPRRDAGAGGQAYHHGDLRRVLIDAAMQLVGEGGPEAVSVREAARRAGVSPGAPFRHFPSRDALMNAVAEEAQRRFRAEIEAALADAPAGDPLGRFRCLGIAYLRWAMKNPTHFEIISSRRFFDHDRSAGVSSDNAELIGLTERTLAEAFSAGQLGPHDLEAGADRRPRAGLRLCANAYRRPFAALGRHGCGRRADGGRTSSTSSLRASPGAAAPAAKSRARCTGRRTGKFIAHS